MDPSPINLGLILKGDPGAKPLFAVLAPEEKIVRPGVDQKRGEETRPVRHVRGISGENGRRHGRGPFAWSAYSESTTAGSLL